MTSRRLRLKTVKGKKNFIPSVTQRIRRLNLQRRFHRIQLCATPPQEPRRSSRVKGISEDAWPSHHVPLRILEEDETGLEVTTLPDKGRGVIATQHFEKGSALLEYVGETVTRSVGIRREKDLPTEAGSYLFYYHHNGRIYCIDATSEQIKRKARLVNHSYSNPNACMRKVICSKQGVRLILFAYKDISPSEEILYDYGERRREILSQYSWLKT